MNHRGNKADALTRKLSSLKALFDYLTNQAEHEKTYEPYLIRNVMAKVKRGKNEKKKETLNNRSEKIKGSILYTEDEFMDFRAFVANDYMELIKEDKRRLLPYLQNRERDIAIVSLLLGSGIRLSEIVGLDVDEIDQKNRTLSILRKGEKADNVIFSDIALDDLMDYLAVRTQKVQHTEEF